MLVKSILRSIGFDFVRYDKIKILFIKLFNKYASHTMIPEKIYVDNLELINGFLKKLSNISSIFVAFINIDSESKTKNL